MVDVPPLGGAAIIGRRGADPKPGREELAMAQAAPALAHKLIRIRSERKSSSRG
jgi:hypothetical protein